MKNFFNTVKEKAKAFGKILMGFVAVTSYDELYRLAILVGGSIAVAIIIFRRLMKDSSLKKNKPNDAYSKSIDFPREVEEDMTIIHPLMRGPLESMLGKNIVSKNFNKGRKHDTFGYSHRNKYMEQAGRYKKNGKKKKGYHDYDEKYDFFKEDAMIYEQALAEDAERKYRKRMERQVQKARKKPGKNLIDEVGDIFKSYGLSY